jgi:PUA domain protein
MSTLSSVPDLLPSVQVDRGAIKFVLKGVDIMSPGCTSAGGDLSADLPAETYVAMRLKA